MGTRIVMVVVKVRKQCNNVFILFCEIAKAQNKSHRKP